MATAYEVELLFRGGNTAALDKLERRLGDLERKLQGGVGGRDPFQPLASSAGGAERGIGALIGTVGKLAAAYVGVDAALRQVKGIQEATFARAGAEQRLRALSAEYGEYAYATTAAAAAGRKFNLSTTESTQQFAQLYGRLRPLGLGLGEITTVYEGFNTAARLSGSTAAEAGNALTQLAQGLGAGALRGDELRSVLEQVPAVTKAITDELGRPAGEIRALAEQGKITSDVVVRALQRIATDGADKLAASLDTPQAKLDRLGAKWEDFQVRLGRPFLSPAADLLDNLSRDVDVATERVETYGRAWGRVQPYIDALGGGLAGLERGVSAVVDRALGINAAFLQPATPLGQLVGLADRLLGKLGLAKVKAFDLGAELKSAFERAINPLGSLLGGLDALAQQMGQGKVANPLNLNEGAEKWWPAGVPLPGTVPGAKPMPQPDRPDPGAKAAYISIEQVGRALQAQGWRVREHPAFGGVGRHAPNSYHYFGEALDITDWRPGDWRGRTRSLIDQLRGSGAGFAELLGPGDPGHSEHGHLAMRGGKVPLTPRLAQILGLPDGGERGLAAVGAMDDIRRQREQAAEEAKQRRLNELGKEEERLRLTYQRDSAGKPRRVQLEMEAKLNNDLLYVDRERAKVRPDPNVEARGAAAKAENLQRQAEVLRDIAALGPQVTDLEAKYSKMFAVDADPLQKEVAGITEDFAGLNRTVDELLQKLADLGGDPALRERLTKLKADIAAANVPGMAAERLARPLREGLEGDIARTRAERRGPPSQAALLQLDKTYQALPAAQQQVLDGLAKQLDAEKIANAEFERTRGLVQDIGSALSTGLSSAIDGLIRGTTTLKEAFADILGNIGKILIQNGITGLLGTINIGGTPLVPRFAEGGYVAGPTLAEVGEGGEPEYIIPSSKMGSAMARYSAGARGDAVLQPGGEGEFGPMAEGGVPGVSVTFAGDIMRFEGTDYVRQDQIPAVVREAALQGAKMGEQRTIRRMQQSPGTRRRLGL